MISVIEQHHESVLNYLFPSISNNEQNGRQILIDAVIHDLIEKYNLFYLSKAQYNIVGSGLVRCLRLPSTTENLTIWKDALQTELKRTRVDHPNNSLVQEFQLKYSKLGSGRPVKQKSGTIATRDRHKQVTNN
ncbi:unnamed protein product [Adineta steineri]|uniref:Uncharacterized protein n=1 Tax=Adineta steineri TaxID=433720 RepID=A0A815NA19_9BILA|nr:unnamed protein product [Adineta steineri]